MIPLRVQSQGSNSDTAPNHDGNAILHVVRKSFEKGWIVVVGVSEKERKRCQVKEHEGGNSNHEGFRVIAAGPIHPVTNVCKPHDEPGTGHDGAIEIDGYHEDVLEVHRIVFVDDGV
jgi:hypothetical protein